jgi:hypothetical protein
MARTLVVGDIHTKTSLLDAVDLVARDFAAQRVVVLGDYLDEWDIGDWGNVEAFEQLLAWAKRRNDVTLLWGNHDIPYFDDDPVIVPSGHRDLIRFDVRELLLRHADLFTVAVALDGWLLTHAGLCERWVRMQGIEVGLSAVELAGALNAMTATGKGRENLAAVGHARGGWGEPGPLWADKSEVLGDAYGGVRQIVGHSPVATCEIAKAQSGDAIVFCDTFSLYSNGAPIGDSSMLLLEDGHVYKVKANETNKEELLLCS